MGAKAGAKVAGLAIERVPIGAIHADPGNVRVHDAKNLKVITDSLTRFGQQKPIVVGKNGVIVAGNGTYEAAVGLGWTEIAIVRTGLKGDEARAYALVDNRSTDLSWFDDAGLAATLKALADAGTDLASLGWTDEDLTGALAALAGPQGHTDPDDVPEAPAEPVTKMGDLWQLGLHRILCGDATKGDDYGRLMGSKYAALCLTDPPYSNGEQYASYTDTDEGLIVLITGFMPLVKKYAASVLVTPGNWNIHKYPPPEWTLAWFCPAGTGSGPWGFSCWQPILAYGSDPHLKRGLGRHPDAFSLIEGAQDMAQDMAQGHPCPKPTRVWAWIMERGSVQARDIILDPFLGSGTTLIVAEQLGRICYGIEIEPRYVDVAVRRWETFTGKKAVRP